MDIELHNKMLNLAMKNILIVLFCSAVYKKASGVCHIVALSLTEPITEQVSSIDF